VREIDEAPHVEELELNGVRFPVVRYTEELTTDNAVVRRAVLRVTEEQFSRCRELLEFQKVSVRRIGVDASPLSLRFGGAAYWSRHDEGGTTCFKQLIHLFPTDLPYSKLDLVTHKDLTPVSAMLVALYSRFEALLDELVDDKTITEEIRTKILGSNWKDLVPEARIDAHIDELQRAHDAEELL
jgi:hypothetical protein